MKGKIRRKEALHDGGMFYPLKDEDIRYIAQKIELNATFMGERYIIADITSPTPICFQHNDWLFGHNNEVFTLDYEQAVKKQAESYSYGGAYVYNGIKFDSCQRELTETLMLDVVIDDNNIHTKLPKFSFFTDTVLQLADRIQANLDRRFGADGNERWRVEVNKNIVETIRDHNISFDQQTVWDALQLVQTEFNLDFVVRGKTWTNVQEYDDDDNYIDEWRLDKPKTIIIGYKGVDILNRNRKDGDEEKSLQYGMGKGLLSLERNIADKDVITRLRCWGSTRNLPYRYYNKLGRTPIFENILQVITYTGADGDMYQRTITPNMIYLPPPPKGSFNTTEEIWPPGEVVTPELSTSNPYGTYGKILYPWWPDGNGTQSYSQNECCALALRVHLKAANNHMVPFMKLLASRGTSNNANANLYGVTLYTECFGKILTGTKPGPNGSEVDVYEEKHLWVRFRAVMWTNVEDSTEDIRDWNICVCPNFGHLCSAFFPQTTNTALAEQAIWGSTWSTAANNWCANGVEAPSYWRRYYFDDNDHTYKFGLMSGSPNAENISAISCVLTKTPLDLQKPQFFYQPVYFVNGLDVDNIVYKYEHTDFWDKLWIQTGDTIEDYSPYDPNADYSDFPNSAPFKTKSNYVRYTKLECDASVLPLDDRLVEMGGIPDGLYMPNLVMDAFRRKCCDYYKLLEDGSFGRVETEDEADFAVHGERWVDGYIDSLRGIEKYGIKEGVITFDNDSRDDLKETVEYREVYPSIERLTAGEVFGDRLPDGMTADQRLDLVCECEEMTDYGVLPEDGSNIDPNVFNLTTYNVGFDLVDYIQTQATEPKIFIKSGLCAGREFDPLPADCAITADGRHYRLLLNRVKDEDIQIALPYKFANIKPGDRFVITGIKMPEEYVIAAERRVTAQGLIYLSIHDHPQVTYAPAVDNIYLKVNNNLGYWFNEGDLINFVDYDLKIKGLLAIQSMIVKYSTGAITEYDITLREKRTEKYEETPTADNNNNNANAYNTGKWHQELDWDDDNGVWLDSDE